MTKLGRWGALALGFALGAAATAFYLGQPRAAAARNDRYQDYVMCTGAAAANPNIPTDGVWLLDYRSGRLLGTVIDRNLGKIVGWAHLDLVTEFGIPPRQDVHFLMTTGNVARGQAALYVAEVTTGRFGVYTMTGTPDGRGIAIQRHDLTTFRPDNNPAAPAAPAPVAPAPAPVAPVVPAPVTPGAPQMPPQP